MEITPNYIKTLVIPQAKKAQASRRVWSIDLETVWLPFFTATNTMGDTAIPSEAIGAPLRLATGKDGSIRISDSGKPVIRVVKDISDMVKLIRENFTAGLMAYSNGVATENPEGYKAEITKAVEAGKPITTHDTTMLLEYRLKMEAEAKAEAKAVIASEAKVSVKVSKPKATRKVKTAKPAPAPPTPPSNGEAPEGDKVPELATV